MHMNSLLTTLEITSYLSRKSATAAHLQTEFGVSIATLKRHLAEARELGAEIDSVKIENVSTYELRNYPLISKRLNRWIELEKARNLRNDS